MVGKLEKIFATLTQLINFQLVKLQNKK